MLRCATRRPAWNLLRRRITRCALARLACINAISLLPNYMPAARDPSRRTRRSPLGCFCPQPGRQVWPRAHAGVRAADRRVLRPGALGGCQGRAAAGHRRQPGLHLDTGVQGERPLPPSLAVCCCAHRGMRLAYTSSCVRACCIHSALTDLACTAVSPWQRRLPAAAGDLAVPPPPPPPPCGVI